LRALITGGAGFIGSHLADELIGRGEDVWIIDDLSTGAIENIDHLKSHDRCRWVRGSVLDEPLMAELIAQCDVVFHLAAAVGVRLIVDSPVRTIETNIRGTEVVLALAAKTKTKVLLTSTSEVYGLSATVPFREDGTLVLGAPTKGRWSYACSKAIDEFLALAYWKERSLPVVIARLFNTVGPRQTGRYGMVLPTFVQQAIAGTDIRVFGSGEQRRCFADVGDVVEGLLRLAEQPQAVGEIVNLGSEDEVTINELALRVRQLTGSSSEIVNIPYAEAYEEGFEDMPRRVPDLAKARSMIGYAPRLSLEQIIARVVEYQLDRTTV
jgi:UDP-glucose 4-epimerase